MKLQVKVIKASNLAICKDSSANLYCCLHLGNNESTFHRTEIKFGTSEPEWNEVFNYYGNELAPFLYSQDGLRYELSGYLTVDVYGHDTINNDDFLGQVMIPLRDVSTSASKEEWYPLTRRTNKDRSHGSLRLEVFLKADRNKIIESSRMDSDLYQRCKLRGYHLPILSGKDIVELPGRTERVEMAFSNVFVEISSHHCTASVYLTNYRIMILSNYHSSKSGRGRVGSADLSTWIALNNIMSLDIGHETIVVQRKNERKQRTTSFTIHCYDVRIIKLIFAFEESKRIPNITTIPEMPPSISSPLNKQLGFRLKNFQIGSPALGRKIKQTFTEKGKPASRPRAGALWHADLGLVKELGPEELQRTRSDAIASEILHSPKKGDVILISPRPRSKSGDSLSKRTFLSVNDEAWRIRRERRDKNEAEGAKGTTDRDMEDRLKCPDEATNSILQVNGYTTKQENMSDIRRSRSHEDISLSHVEEGRPRANSQEEADFCVLSYAGPDNLDTGGTYTVIFDESDLFLSDDEGMDDRSCEVKDLTPSRADKDSTDGGTRNRTSSVPLPRATRELLQAFQQRIESIMVNSVDYPPGLFFSQLYEGYLEHTGWDMYSFPREMDRQDVSEEKWKLSVLNGPEYKICSTYPQLMYVPKTVEDSVILESAKFRSKDRFPCLVWVDSKRQNFMLRCAQPLAGKAQKHSLEDEQLIEACLNAGPPDGHMVIFDARSIVAAAGNMLKGKGTENVTHYPRAKLTHLDIPNIHAVRESYDSLRALCLSNESSKWYSSLENTGWLNYLSLIIKGAVMIARYMKLQRGNVLVHCSDGWDRTSQLTSLAQIIMDPYYRTITGFMILIEKEWLAFGHKFQHRLGHPDYPNERSPVFLQFLDCVYQMLRLFPKSFEFNSSFLLRIADHLNTGWFGTFLCNCDKERHGLSLYARSPSLWAHLLADKEALLNHEYTLNRQPIIPTSNLRHLKLWEEYFLRHDSSSLTPYGWRREVDSKDQQNKPVMQRGTSTISDNLQENWTADHVIWIADDKATECMYCHGKFSIVKRKHHCRACGQIFCDDCSKNKIALLHLGYSQPQRVCTECFSKLDAAQKTSDTDDGFLLVSCHDDF